MYHWKFLCQKWNSGDGLSPVQCPSNCPTVDGDKNFVPIVALLLGYIEEQMCHNSEVIYTFHNVFALFNGLF